MENIALSENLTNFGDRNCEFPVEGRENCLGYLSLNENEKSIGLVLIQEWWGLNKAITTTAETISKEGFRVLIPDLYRGKVAKNHEEAGHLKGGLDWIGALKDINASGEYLKSLGCEKVALMGFCVGGALTLATLTQESVFFKGVPFYGSPDLEKFDITKIKVPILAHFAELDNMKGFSDPETAQKIKDLAISGGINFTLHVWTGADHAFMNQDSYRYNKEIAVKALRETVQFLKDN
jgi:carboxymethylenebutenolidase